MSSQALPGEVCQPSWMGLLEQYLSSTDAAQMSGSSEEIQSFCSSWRIISCLKAELVFAENPSHLIDDCLCMLLCPAMVVPGAPLPCRGYGFHNMVNCSQNTVYIMLHSQSSSTLKLPCSGKAFTNATIQHIVEFSYCDTVIVQLHPDISCWAFLMPFLAI